MAEAARAQQGSVLPRLKGLLPDMVRMRLAPRSGVPDIQQRRFTAAVVIGTAAAVLAGWWFDREQQALLGGMAAVFMLVSTGGQSLRADVRRFAWLAPTLALVVGCGPLLSRIPVLSGIFVTLVVFGAGMLPAMGERYRVAGQVLAAAAIAGATTGIAAGHPWESLGAAAFGVAYATGLRLLIGRGDRNRATRAAVAQALVTPGPGPVEYATSLWRADATPTWLGDVLAGAARFRAAREALLAQSETTDRFESGRLRQIAADADLVVDELAKAVQARACTGLPALARADPAASVLRDGGPQDLPEPVTAMREGLDRIRAAVVSRDDTPATDASAGRTVRERIARAARAHLSPRSSLFRHALRCALAVAVGGLVLVWLRDPAASTLMLALYAVLQPAARDNMAGALTRTGAAVLGVVVLAAIVPLLPYGIVLLPILVVAMMLGAGRLREDYPLLIVSLITLVVVAQAVQLDRPAANIAISFAATTAIGATIAMVVGYVSYLVLPGSVVPDVSGMLRSAIWATSELLRSVRATTRGEEMQHAVSSAHVLTLRRTQDLLGLPAQLNGDADPDKERAVQDAGLALDALRRDVASLACRPAAERAVALPALHSADALLAGSMATQVPDCPDTRAPATETLASSLVENALHARRAIDEVIEPESPWRSYSISFLKAETMHID